MGANVLSLMIRADNRAFSTGDRVQLTAPARELEVANREIGTIVSIGQRADKANRIGLKMDDGREVGIDPAKHPLLDHGYAVTRHSSQGQAAERVLVHVDTELGAKDMLNNRKAYVAISRGAHDAQLFTNAREKPPLALGHDVSHQSAHVPEISPQQSIQQEIERMREQSHGHGISMKRAARDDESVAQVPRVSKLRPACAVPSPALSREEGHQSSERKQQEFSF